MFGALQLEGCGFESTSKQPRRDPGQVLHSQLLMRFGVKLRFSVRAVVGSASEWEIWLGRYNKCSNTIQYNTIQYIIIYNYTYTCIYLHTPRCICTYIYIYIHTYTYINTYIPT